MNAIYTAARDDASPTKRLASHARLDERIFNHIRAQQFAKQNTFRCLWAINDIERNAKPVMACQKCRNAWVGTRPVSFQHHQLAIINQCRQHRGYGGGFKNQRFIGFAGDAPIGGYIDKDQLALGAGSRTRVI